MKKISNIIKSSKPFKLLFVEDNEDARNSSVDILEDFFSHITVAVDGQDGLDKFKEESFDIIITDINMPNLNGIEMCSEIRKINKNISILMLSAHNDIEYFIESIKLNIDGYILKPFDINQFVNTLNNVILKINEHKSSEKNLNLLQQYQELTDKSSIISKTNTKGIITYVNDEFCKISGYSKEELLGSNHNIVRHPDEPAESYVKLWNTIKKEKSIWQGVLRNRSKNGKSYYVQSTIKPILDINDNIIEYIALRDDITKIMDPKKQLKDLVATTVESLVVLIYIENFDNIENFYGHKIVENLEKKLYYKLYNSLPKECSFDKIYILGDGKYAIAKDKDACDKSTKTILNNLQEFQKDINEIMIEIDSIKYDVHFIMSVAYGEDSLENVKLGIEELKKTKQKFIVSNGMAKKNFEKSKENIKTLTKIKNALEDYRIISHFQPIIDNKTREIVKYESLVRLQDVDGKILSPFFFLDVAKQGQYYSQITSSVLKNSFDALKITNMDISINLSALDIEKESVRDEIFSYLDEYKDESSRIVIELLEDENITNINVIKKFITDIKTYDVKIAIDDFGAGYSNFERLLEYQPDILKIDGSLIRDVNTNNYSYSIVKTIVTFAKSQNLEVIAEFIENKEIYDTLCELGVDYSQGYYFGKPEPLPI